MGARKGLGWEALCDATGLSEKAVKRMMRGGLLPGYVLHNGDGVRATYVVTKPELDAYLSGAWTPDRPRDANEKERIDELSIRNPPTHQWPVAPGHPDKHLRPRAGPDASVAAPLPQSLGADPRPRPPDHARRLMDQPCDDRDIPVDDHYEEDPETIAILEERRAARWTSLSDAQRAQAAERFAAIPF
jgi:hypothetical protein